MIIGIRSYPSGVLVAAPTGVLAGPAWIWVGSHSVAVVALRGSLNLNGVDDWGLLGHLHVDVVVHLTWKNMKHIGLKQKQSLQPTIQTNHFY